MLLVCLLNLRDTRHKSQTVQRTWFLQRSRLACSAIVGLEGGGCRWSFGGVGAYNCTTTGAWEEFTVSHKIKTVQPGDRRVLRPSIPLWQALRLERYYSNSTMTAPQRHRCYYTWTDHDILNTLTILYMVTKHIQQETQPKLQLSLSESSCSALVLPVDGHELSVLLLPWIYDPLSE